MGFLEYHLDNLLTVILIIRDRPFYAFRWMNYANTTHFPFKILIADGGKDLSVENNLREATNYPNLIIEKRLGYLKITLGKIMVMKWTFKI